MWDEVRANAEVGNLEEIPSDIFIRNYSTLKAIARDYQRKPDDLPGADAPDRAQIGYWYYGKTGVGKTYAANNDFPDAYRKVANNKWWCGYQGEDNVIIDDLDKKHEYMGYHLKIWGDRYAFIGETKGSSRFIRPKVICVTSNYHPKDIWDDDSTLGPILRRFKVVHFQTLEDQFYGEPDVEVRGAFVPGFVVPQSNT